MSRSRVGVLYLFQEAQSHWLPVLGVPPRVVPYTWLVLNVIAARYSRLDLKNTPIKTIFVDKKKVNRDTKTKPEKEQCEYTNW